MKMARLFYAGDETVMLVYISQGVQFSIPDAMKRINASDLLSPLSVNTCSVTSGIKKSYICNNKYSIKYKFFIIGILPDIPTRKILSDIMNKFFIDKNFHKNHLIFKGQLAFINNPSSIGAWVARFYEMYNIRLHRTTLQVSLPAWDSVSQGMHLYLNK